MKLMEEDEIVKRLIKRDETAIELVIDLYGGLIKSIIKKHLNGFECYIDECINDVLLSIWDNIKQFDHNKNSFKNWICAISKYKSIDYKRKHYKELVLESLDEKLSDKRFAKDADLIDDINSEIESMLNYLSPKDRKLFFEHYVMNEGITNLSKKMNTKSSVLYNRLSRGRKKIKDNFLRSELS
jgi:RNA polymerase sigma-70 factor (ECF subfamily)